MSNFVDNRTTAQSGDGSADGEWFGGRRWTGIAAIAVLLVVAVCVAIVLIPQHRAAHPTTRPVTTDTGSPASDITVQSTDSDIPTAAPSGTVWTVFDTVALPTISGQGPRHVDGAVATGYAQTPTGALLAAVNEDFRLVLADDTQDWRTAARAMLAPGPGRDGYLTLRAGQAQPPAVSGDYAQVQGFQFVSYSASDAVIELVTRDVHGTLQTGPLHVSWLDGDWRLVLPPSGLGTAQTTTSLAGFVAWSGV